MKHCDKIGYSCLGEAEYDGRNDRTEMVSEKRRVGHPSKVGSHGATTIDGVPMKPGCMEVPGGAKRDVTSRGY